MYISLALGLIADAKQRQCLVEYSLLDVHVLLSVNMKIIITYDEPRNGSIRVYDVIKIF